MDKESALAMCMLHKAYYSSPWFYRCVSNFETMSYPEDSGEIDDIPEMDEFLMDADDIYVRVEDIYATCQRQEEFRGVDFTIPILPGPVYEETILRRFPIYAIVLYVVLFVYLGLITYYSFYYGLFGAIFLLLWIGILWYFSGKRVLRRTPDTFVRRKKTVMGPKLPHHDPAVYERDVEIYPHEVPYILESARPAMSSNGQAHYYSAYMDVEFVNTVKLGLMDRIKYKLDQMPSEYKLVDDPLVGKVWEKSEDATIDIGLLPHITDTGIIETLSTNNVAFNSVTYNIKRFSSFGFNRFNQLTAKGRHVVNDTIRAALIHKSRADKSTLNMHLN